MLAARVGGTVDHDDSCAVRARLVDSGALCNEVLWIHAILLLAEVRNLQNSCRDGLAHDLSLLGAGMTPGNKLVQLHFLVCAGMASDLDLHITFGVVRQGGVPGDVCRAMLTRMQPLVAVLEARRAMSMQSCSCSSVSSVTTRLAMVDEK